MTEAVFDKPLKAHGMQPGKLLSRTWHAPFTHGLTDLWRRRCHEYWERIEIRFGVILSEPRNAWFDDPVEGPTVTTFATVLAEVPGRREIMPRSTEVH